MCSSPGLLLTEQQVCTNTGLHSINRNCCTLLFIVVTEFATGAQESLLIWAGLQEGGCAVQQLQRISQMLLGAFKHLSSLPLLSKVDPIDERVFLTLIGKHEKRTVLKKEALLGTFS